MRRMISNKKAKVLDNFAVNDNGTIIEIGGNVHIDGDLEFENSNINVFTPNAAYELIREEAKKIGGILFIDIELKCLQTNSVLGAFGEGYKPKHDHPAVTYIGTLGDEYTPQAGIRVRSNGTLGNIGTAIGVDKYIHIHTWYEV